MSQELTEFFERFKNAGSQMKRDLPSVSTGFGTLFSKVMADGVLSIKQKELIAVAIGVAIQCEPCIRLHVKKCLEAGATKDEILEASSVAVMMAGGPAYTHIPIVTETLEYLQAEARD